MTVRASKNIASLGGYAFAEVGRLVEDLLARDIHVLDFGVGDPSAPTPRVVRERAKAAIDEHAASGYPSYIGSADFRRGVADWVQRRFAVTVDPGRHVSSTIGSKEAVFHMPFAFIDPGDVVISPNPGYPPFTRGTLFAGGENWTYPVVAENDFLPDLGAIPDDVLARTRMLWVNYPNSPTGALAPLGFFEEVSEFCRKRDILLVSDEAYCDLWYGDDVPVSALQTGLDHVISTFSLSKRSNMTGWRCGFVVGDADAVAHFRKLKTNIDSGTPNFIQEAALTALEDREHGPELRAEYLEKRNLLSSAFTGIGLPNCAPEGTMFMWQRVPEGITSVDFAKRLLDPEIALVVTPGTWLSSDGPDGVNPGEGYVRLAMVPDVSSCREAGLRIAKLA
jgi:LL-diaminopimelate aminotransferase